MLKNKLFTRPLKTSDITISSNVTSIRANVIHISRVEEIAGHEKENPSAIHLDLKVEHPVKFHDVLEATEEMEMILNLEDAVELGLLMVAMGMEHKTPEEVSAAMSRLSQLIEEYR